MKYTIPKGLHISHILPKLFRDKPLLNFDFVFTSNCIYDIGSTYNQAINKLYGRSFGLIHNTSTIWGKLFPRSANSFRLGWNCSAQNRKIQLYAYYYNDGERKSEYITDISLNKAYNVYLYFDRIANKIIVDIKSDDFNSHTLYDFRFKKCRRWGLILHPYFGGKLSAPHKMIIYINQLN